MTLYGYARVSVREPEDKNLDLQVERLVRAGCSLGNIRAEEASGARNDRGGLLELLDLVVEGDTLVVTHIDRLSRGLTHGLQVIEGLHRAGVEFRSLSEDFDTAEAFGLRSRCGLGQASRSPDKSEKPRLRKCRISATNRTFDHPADAGAVVPGGPRRVDLVADTPSVRR